MQNKCKVQCKGALRDTHGKNSVFRGKRASSSALVLPGPSGGEMTKQARFCPLGAMVKLSLVALGIKALPKGYIGENKVDSGRRLYSLRSAQCLLL